MDRLDTMKVFSIVAKQQSFVAAANELGLSAPAVTRSIAALETHLGVKLFNRTTRLVRLTEPGRRFLLDVERIIEDLAEAEAAVAGIYAKPSGSLTITAPVLFGEKYVMPIINEYLLLYPGISVKLMFYDRLTSLLEEEIDIAVRIGHLQDSNLFATCVGEICRVVCAAPSYFENRDIPTKPADLVNHDIIFPTTFESAYGWTFHNQGKKESVSLTPRLMCNNNNIARQLAVLGYGITRLMSYQVEDELKSGALKRILKEYEESPLPINIMHLERRKANAKIRTFIDLAVERLSEHRFYR